MSLGSHDEPFSSWALRFLPNLKTKVLPEQDPASRLPRTRESLDLASTTPHVRRHKFVRSMRHQAGPGAASPAPAPATSRRSARIPAESPSEVFAGASRKLPAGAQDRSITR